MNQRFFVAVFLLIFTLPVLADKMYVRSMKCKVMAAPNFKAEVIDNLAKGTEVEVVEKKGGWFKVSHDSGSGWVSKFLLTKNAAVLKRNTILKFDEEQTGNVRKRASVITTAAAARGLTARENESLNQPAIPGQDFDALKLMESFKPSAEEVDAFIQSMSEQP